LTIICYQASLRADNSAEANRVTLGFDKSWKIFLNLDFAGFVE